MKIKATVKEGFAESGQTEIMDEHRMRQICLNCASMTYRKGMQGTPQEEANQRLLELAGGHKLENFYATYELVEA